MVCCQNFLMLTKNLILSTILLYIIFPTMNVVVSWVFSHLKRDEFETILSKGLSSKRDSKKESIEWHFTPLTGTRTRNHRELVKNCDQHFHFFNNRLTNIWNWLSEIVIRADSVNQFKNRLDEIWHKQPINLN